MNLQIIRGGRGGRDGGRGRGRGGGRGGGMKGGAKVVVEPHRHEGVFIARGKEDALVTLNSTPGVAVYGEKRISVETPPGPDGNAVKVEYRVWNPFRSKREFFLCFDYVEPLRVVADLAMFFQNK